MSKLFSKLGFIPKWGNVQSIKNFLANPDFKRRLSEIRKKKMSNPKIDVSNEIKDLLEKQNDPEP